MPRFGIKSLLLVFFLVALWLLPFSLPAGFWHIHTAVLLVLFASSGVATLFTHGSERAFWAGFFAVMFVMGSDLFPKYIATDNWWDYMTQLIVKRFSLKLNDYNCLKTTLWAGCTLWLAALAGCISVRIYNRNQKTE